MKKLSVIIISFIAVFSFSGIAIAIPIEFDVSGSSSSVMITDINKWGWTGISATKVSSLGDTPFTLNDGDSQTFDFFTVNVGGFGGGTAHILATLAFDKPPDATNADGTGYVGWIIAGVLGGGSLIWDQPETITLASGDYFDVSFENTSWFGNCTTVQATVTAHAAPVPEPATLLLLGTGLIGLWGARKKFKN